MKRRNETNTDKYRITIPYDSSADDSAFRIAGGELLGYRGSEVSVSLPEGITRIGASAFSDNQQLEEVFLPEGVREIGSCAFRDCWNLKQVHLPDTITVIEAEAFLNCSSLCRINVPEGAAMDPTAFTDCCGLADSNGVLIINHTLAAYYGDRTIREFNVPEGVTIINDYAFAELTDLETVNLPETISYIGEMAFSGCYSLQDIHVPEHAVIGPDAFDFCLGLCNSDGLIIVNHIFYGGGYKTSPVLKIPYGVTRIEDYADIYNRIEAAELPDTLEYIGKDAFSFCTELRTVNIPDSVKVIEKNAFENCVSLTGVIIPEHCTVHPTAFSVIPSLSPEPEGVC